MEPVYFSYFNNRRTKERGLARISIALKSYEIGLVTDLTLCPPKTSFYKYKNKEITKDELLLDYIMIKLQDLNIKEVYNKYAGKVLLCHEKIEENNSEVVCHRQLLMFLLKEKGFPAEELPNS